MLLVLAFDFIGNGKAKKPASYKLAIHTVFFLNILHKFYKIVFWKFSNEHFELHFTKFSVATREFYIIWEALCQLKHPC